MVYISCNSSRPTYLQMTRLRRGLRETVHERLRNTVVSLWAGRHGTLRWNIRGGTGHVVAGLALILLDGALSVRQDGLSDCVQ